MIYESTHDVPPDQIFPVVVQHLNGREDIVPSYEPSDQGAILDCSVFGCDDCETWSL